jgi:drug/metabolite transporter (DMT)-like permease
MTARISTAGIIAGVLLILFGAFTVAMMYFMAEDPVGVSGSGIFIVAGGALFTYSFLTRETRKKYGMNKIRAGLYALAIGAILFGVFTSVITRFATGEMYVAIASLMVFFMSGIGLFMFLALTGTDRRKYS